MSSKKYNAGDDWEIKHGTDGPYVQIRNVRRKGRKQFVDITYLNTGKQIDDVSVKKLKRKL